MLSIDALRAFQGFGEAVNPWKCLRRQYRRRVSVATVTIFPTITGYLMMEFGISAYNMNAEA